MPGNTNTGSRVEQMGGEPLTLEPLVIEKKKRSPIANRACCIGIQMDLRGGLGDRGKKEADPIPMAENFFCVFQKIPG